MRNLSLLLLILLFACNLKKEKECTLSSDLGAEENGSFVIAPYMQVQSMEEYNSNLSKTEINEGKMLLKLGKEKVCLSASLKINGEQYKIEFFTDHNSLILVKNNAGKYKIAGGELNEEYQKLKTIIHDQTNTADVKSEKKEALDKKYKEILWELLDTNHNSIPLSYFFYKEYRSAKLEVLDKIISGFSKEIHETYYLRKLIEFRDAERRTSIGAIAPDFTLNSNLGKTINLNDYRGSYLVVDFWASWCGPCRHEIPNLKRIHKIFKSKGLSMLSVSLDAEESKWLQAIEKENMPWVQVRDTKKISDSYNIHHIPVILLIDPQGKIAAKNVFGQELYNEVEKVMSDL